MQTVVELGEVVSLQRLHSLFDGSRALARAARKFGLSLPTTCRRKTAPALSPEMLAAYGSTDFVALSHREHPLRIGAPVPAELIALLNDHHAESAVVVTAYNPFSTPLPDHINELRQEFLRQDLAKCGLDHSDAEGRDPSGLWPVEPSLLVFGVSNEQVLRLLVDYQQHAAVAFGLDEPARLVLHPGHMTRSRAVGTGPF